MLGDQSGFSGVLRRPRSGCQVFGFLDLRLQVSLFLFFAEGGLPSLSPLSLFLLRTLMVKKTGKQGRPGGRETSTDGCDSRPEGESPSECTVRGRSSMREDLCGLVLRSGRYIRRELDQFNYGFNW